MQKCRIASATRKKFKILLPNGKIVEGILSGKAVFKQDVKVGDWVEVENIQNKENSVLIKKIHPRTSSLIRGRGYKSHTIVSNIDQLLAILSAKQPEFKNSLLDRFLLIAEKNKIPAIICINKIDLVDAHQFDTVKAYYNKINYKLLYSSAKTGIGIDELKSIIYNKTTAVLGHSGVGKSSLINKIDPTCFIKTQSISEKSKKGKHTTTHCQLFPIGNSSAIIDTPGVKELGIGDILKKDIKNYFIEFSQFSQNCKFSNCNHYNEPQCAVKEAVEKNDILKDRYLSYCNLYTDLAKYDYEWEQGKISPV